MSSYDQQGPATWRTSSFGPGAISPFVKWTVIANVVVFVLQMVLGARFTDYFALSTATFLGSFPASFFQVFTYMFLHGGFLHLLFNMLVLWMFGTQIEFTWGTPRFARFYILSGLAGGLLSLLVHVVFSTAPSVIVGASGAIYGVMIAYWFMFPDNLLYVFFVLPVKVKWAIPGMMILGFLFGGSSVAHAAHLGGALFGAAYMKRDWRALSLNRRLKNLRYRRMEAKLSRQREEAADVMRKVDTILDKINQVGIDNLSKSERRFLEEASSQLSKRSNKPENTR
jgi:membrane associated rhomboid family serine protease